MFDKSQDTRGLMVQEVKAVASKSKNFFPVGKGSQLKDLVWEDLPEPDGRLKRQKFESEMSEAFDPKQARRNWIECLRSSQKV